MPTRRTVHPRVCGELGRGRRRTVRGAGSSPRVRGTRTCPTPSRPPPTVHPRVCGELLQTLEPELRQAGSSPRVRGTRREFGEYRGQVRFIPACAGNSLAPAASTAVKPVHPRVCGELPNAVGAWCDADGSSPRVRGTLRRRAARIGSWRFIPACAGNSRSVYLAQRRRTVHPRVCGELLLGRMVGVAVHGSSPRVRGTR